MKTLYWLRNDLRTEDNPALAHAAGQGEVVAVYIEEETNTPWSEGAASRWWRQQSLAALSPKLPFVQEKGDPRDILPALAHAHGCTHVVWNRRYEPHNQHIDAEVKELCREANLTVTSFKANLLFEPWEITNGSGAPYKVFTPFWKACLMQESPLPCPAAPSSLPVPCSPFVPTFLPSWAKSWPQHWHPGEAGAQQALQIFLDQHLEGYGDKRDFPSQNHTSRLSPHLHFGEISPRTIWHAVHAHVAKHPSLKKDADKFLAEIGWREFSHHILAQAPTLPDENWKPAFNAYPWEDNPAHLQAWQQGKTGYPIVDAGMRQLWQTGTLHNRVRMICASFLIKHLGIHWREGELWFWDTLLDADLANNAAGWQWVAGSGADASPYFRIFNPIMQAAKFDSKGDYIRRYVPELSLLPTNYLFAPWEAPPLVLQAAGITLGTTYPKPLVRHEDARKRALAGYEKVRDASF
ncbi:MAG: deoxyribodipyrimidine photolyase [Alphaproteobacteria bacterium CG_4_10_14_0_8_um_filter_53_9]|nr:MAG: deoxyribodipyrimidine photolyase [Alphaproteobacteria bacterium CG_4_10_14_0_8_um_filter_53_9]